MRIYNENISLNFKLNSSQEPSLYVLIVSHDLKLWVASTEWKYEVQLVRSLSKLDNLIHQSIN